MEAILEDVIGGGNLFGFGLVSAERAAVLTVS